MDDINIGLLEYRCDETERWLAKRYDGAVVELYDDGSWHIEESTFHNTACDPRGFAAQQNNRGLSHDRRLSANSYRAQYQHCFLPVPVEAPHSARRWPPSKYNGQGVYYPYGKA